MRKLTRPEWIIIGVTIAFIALLFWVGPDQTNSTLPNDPDNYP